MDNTKEIGAIGASNHIDTISIAPLTTSDLDSMLMTSADTLTMGSISIGNGRTGYTIGPGTHSNVTWTTGTNTSAIGQQVYTIGSNANPYSDISAIGGLHTQSGKLSLNGEKADIDINGKSMLQWMQKVEERLNILTPNSELEKEWDDLRKLGERYRKLEKKCKEKAEMWKKLKSMPALKVN